MPRFEMCASKLRRKHEPISVAERSKACWDCGFDSIREHGYLSLLNVVNCWVEVTATS
jgi:hypothetical protein